MQELEVCQDVTGGRMMYGHEIDMNIETIMYITRMH